MFQKEERIHQHQLLAFCHSRHSRQEWFQFVATDNAELGFVSRSQVTLDGKLTRGRAWEVPNELHQPIEQQAVLVRDSVAARAFLEFIRGAEARAVIERYGYGVPDLPAAQAR